MDVNLIFWMLQAVLGLGFAAAGVLHLSQPKERLDALLGWPAEFSTGTVRAIGLAELLGGIGLIVPPLAGLWPWVTPLAALGLALVMAGAFWTHLHRHEPQNMAFNAVLLILLLIVAWGRYRVAPF